jgi:hypothetical protein
MKKLALLTWEQLMRLLEFLAEILKWVLPIVINNWGVNNDKDGKEDKKDEDDTRTEEQ